MGVSAGIISHLLLAFSLLSSSVSLKPDRRSFPLSGSVFNQFLGSGWPKAAGNYTCKAAELLDQQAPVGCRWCYYGACNSWQTVVETFFFLHLSTWPYLRWCLGSWDHSHKYRPSSLLNVKITWILESTWVLDLPANYILGFFFLTEIKHTVPWPTFTRSDLFWLKFPWNKIKMLNSCMKNFSLNSLSKLQATENREFSWKLTILIVGSTVSHTFCDSNIVKCFLIYYVPLGWWPV